MHAQEQHLGTQTIAMQCMQMLNEQFNNLLPCSCPIVTALYSKGPVYYKTFYSADIWDDELTDFLLFLNTVT